MKLFRCQQMKRTLSKSVTVIILVVTVGCVLPTHIEKSFPASEEKLIFEIFPDKSSYQLDEVITIHGRVTNTSKNTVYFDPPWDFYTKKYLNLKNAKINKALTDKFLVEYDTVANKSEIAIIAPGETYNYDFKITLKYYSVQITPGAYEFYVNYCNNRRWVDGVPSWIGELTSNVINIEFE